MSDKRLPGIPGLPPGLIIALRQASWVALATALPAAPVQAAPADTAAASAPGRLLHDRVAAVRAALTAWPAPSLSATPTPNWTNWPKWSKWSNWSNK